MGNRWNWMFPHLALFSSITWFDAPPLLLLYIFNLAPLSFASRLRCSKNERRIPVAKIWDLLKVPLSPITWHDTHPNPYRPEISAESARNRAVFPSSCTLTSVLCVCHLEPSSILICVTLQLESQAGALGLPGFTCDRRLTSPSPPHLINTLFQIGPKQAFSIFLQQFHGMTMFHVPNQLKYKDFLFPFKILP